MVHSDQIEILIAPRPLKDIYTDGIVGLVFKQMIAKDRAIEQIPSILFEIVRVDNQLKIGEIDLRLGYNPGISLYSGHMGYHIIPSQRVQGFATRASQLLKQVAIEHGMSYVWITCNPDNTASVKTIEHLGARYVNTVNVPMDHVLWRRGDRRKQRYLWRF